MQRVQRLVAADFTFAPNSLTQLLCRGQGSVGAIEAFEALAEQHGSRACAWKALLGQCRKTNCSRCQSGETANAADVQKVRAAAVTGLL